MSTIIEPGVSADSGKAVFNIAAQPAAISVRQVPQKLVDSLKKDDDFWYANAMLPKKKMPAAGNVTRRKSLFQTALFHQFLWFVVLSAFLGIVFWYMQSSNIFIFRRKAKKITDADAPLEETENIFALQYDKEISLAEESKNHRLAVRLWYLQTLKKLTDGNLIDYRFGSTNSDYVAQLGNTTYHRDFLRLTRNFEYTWYGQFELSAEAYTMMRQQFITFQNGLCR